MEGSFVIYNASVNGGPTGWVAVDPPFIACMGEGTPPADIIDQYSEKIDGKGFLLLPGAIDTHVHFREPGMTHKGTIASESAAALAGGVTSYIEMPNTRPSTTTLEAWHDKTERAARDSVANYAFMIGATSDNIDQLQKADPGLIPAVKVFMGSSTGNMLLSDTVALCRVFAEQPLRVVVHAEDQAIIDRLSKQYADRTDIAVHSLVRPAEACVRATERAMEMAARYGSRLHIAHLSTEKETQLFDASPTPSGKSITAEVSPHHLTFTEEDYPRLGARIKMNPSIKTAGDRSALRKALIDGRIDNVATDHAPHLLSEKTGVVWEAVSGAPMVQFSLPLMLDMFPIATVIARMSEGPAMLFGIDRRGQIKPGYYADLVLVEKLTEPQIISDDDVISLCGWTPLAGRVLGHRVVRTWVNGGLPPQPLKFS